MDKLLDLLKINARTAFALTVASVLAIIGFRRGLIPDPGPTVLAVVYLAFLLSACLTVTGAAQAFMTFLKPGGMIGRFNAKRLRRKRAKAYIAHMTEEDRQIIGHLLHHNRKTFSAAGDGGYARELIAQGFILPARRPGMLIDNFHWPFVVEDDAWDVFVEHKAEFPFKDDGTDPWRVAL